MRSRQIKNLCSSSLWTCLHHMVILGSQNKITDFFMILAWASPFNIQAQMLAAIKEHSEYTPGKKTIISLKFCKVLCDIPV